MEHLMALTEWNPPFSQCRKYISGGARFRGISFRKRQFGNPKRISEAWLKSPPRTVLSAYHRWLRFFETHCRPFTTFMKIDTVISRLERWLLVKFHESQSMVYTFENRVPLMPFSPVWFPLQSPYVLTYFLNDVIVDPTYNGFHS